MAKFGEGDPRWIVADRADGANVNNWHWTECNCTNWSKEKLTNLFSNLIFKEDSESSLKTTKVDSIGGDVTVGTRKGKIYYIYELDIKITWEGTLKGKTYTGKIDMPSIESDESDFEVTVNSEEKSKESTIFTDYLKGSGISTIKSKFQEFLDLLKQEHAEKILKKVPTTEQKTEDATPARSILPTSVSSATNSSDKQQKKKDENTSKVHLNHSFNAPPIEIYRAHLDAPRIAACTQSACQIEPKEGSKFSMFGGNVTGEIVRLDSPNKIVQKWRFNNWTPGLFSEVVLQFDEQNGGTRVSLTQTGVPVDDVERVSAGWKENFWNRMMVMCGWGGMLL